MKRAAWPVLLTLVGLAASPASEPAVGPLIDGLGADEPETRQRSAETLKSLGDEVVPALRRALRDPRPAVAEAAAEVMLARLNRPWTDPRDSPSVRLMLNGSNYGLQPVEGRAEILAGLRAPGGLGGDNGPFLPGASATIVRVILQDPADEVAMQLAYQIDLAADGMAAGLAAPPATRPLGLDVMLAKALFRNADPAALPLIRRVLNRDRDDGGLIGSDRVLALHVATQAEVQSGDPAKLVRTLRDTSGQPQDDGVIGPNARLALHAAHGPLPGLSSDLLAANADARPMTDFALAECARRYGMPTAAAALAHVGLVRREKESLGSDVSRFDTTADDLTGCGADLLACRALERVIAVADSDSNVVREAELKLSLLHERAGRFGHAADVLQRAINRSDTPRFRRDARQPRWTTDDAQARVYLNCLLHALGRKDKDAARRHAEQLAEIECDDADLIALAVGHIDRLLGTKAADSYFAHAYDRAKSKIGDEPTEPVWRNGLAWLCARCDRRLPEAVAAAEMAVAMKPGEASFLDTLAEAKFRVGKVQDAIDAERRALEAGNEDEWFIRDQIERFEAVRK